MPTPQINHLWPLLPVTDINRSLAFYRDQLGFEVARLADHEGRLDWCRLQRGGASLMLQQADETTLAANHTRGISLYFICNDADEMYKELTARGLNPAPPSVADYGMKQLSTPEPDGYTICFESPTEKWV